MNLEVTNKTDEPLLSRMRVEGSLTFDKATPSAKDVQQSVAKKVNKGENLVVVKRIDTKYGSQTASIVSYVYENQDALKTLEKIKEEPKKEGAEGAAEEKPAEAPKAEEKKEEAPKAEAKEEKPAAKEEKKAEDKPEAKTEDRKE